MSKHTSRSTMTGLLSETRITGTKEKKKKKKKNRRYTVRIQSKCNRHDIQGCKMITATSILHWDLTGYSRPVILLILRKFSDDQRTELAQFFKSSLIIRVHEIHKFYHIWPAKI